MELNRHQLREVAFQTLFSRMYHPDLTTEESIEYTVSLMDGMTDEMFEIPVYLETLVTGVSEKQTELDGYIEKHLKGWSISRLAKTDLIVLRLSIFEMMYISDVPNKVSLNEALELAKTYSDEQSKRFINGVLSSVLKEIEVESE